MLAGAIPESNNGLGLDALPTASFARTGLVSGSQRSVATVLTQTSLPDFGVGGGPEATQSIRVLIRELLSGTHSAFWESVPEQPSAAPPDIEAVPPGRMEEGALSDVLADLFAQAGSVLPPIPGIGMLEEGIMGTPLPPPVLPPSLADRAVTDGDTEDLADADLPTAESVGGSHTATAFFMCWGLLLGGSLTVPEPSEEADRAARRRGPRSPAGPGR
jgi:hypothetical protein